MKAPFTLRVFEVNISKYLHYITYKASKFELTFLLSTVTHLSEHSHYWNIMVTCALLHLLIIDAYVLLMNSFSPLKHLGGSMLRNLGTHKLIICRFTAPVNLNVAQ